MKHNLKFNFFAELRDSEEFKILQDYFSGLFIRTALMNLKTFEKKVRK